jgi:hypothetical protein
MFEFCHLPTAKHCEDAGISIPIKWAYDSYSADEEAARRYAILLIDELASSGFYSSRRCFLEVKTRVDDEQLSDR